MPSFLHHLMGEKMKTYTLAAAAVLGLTGFTSAMATENPMDFAKSEYRRVAGTCSWHHHGWLFFVMNQHPSRSLVITVETSWLYNNQSRTEEKDYPVAAGKERAISCNIPGPTGQRFDHKITEARFR